MAQKESVKKESLNTLQERMRGCRLCLEAGHDVVPGAVFRGEATAKVFLVGQAPGPTEVTAKRPFNAGSGRRLFQWLGEAGWEEDDFRKTHYMTAVTKCYPGRHPNGKGDRVPSKEEQSLCRPYLEQEIAYVRPKLMILVGGLAIKLLYPKSSKLVDVIGTAVYFPPERLKNPVNFNIKEGYALSTFDETLDKNGRWVIPLPHPSGASLWPNKPENQVRIQKAIHLLSQAKIALKC